MRGPERANTLATLCALHSALYAPEMGVLERIRRLFSDEDRMVDTDSTRIDKLTSTREGQALTQNEGGGIPPNYLPTGVDESRPKK
jgi:hypothetical protein